MIRNIFTPPGEASLARLARATELYALTFFCKQWTGGSAVADAYERAAQIVKEIAVEGTQDETPEPGSGGQECDHLFAKVTIDGKVNERRHCIKCEIPEPEANSC